MKFKPNKPSLVHILKWKFPAIMDDTTIMVWGDVIYTPHKLSPQLLAHEKVHIKQQRNKPLGLIWWFRYTLSPKFRLKQEIEAFRAQYGANRTQDELYTIATNLSGEMYNNIISFEEAAKQINDNE